MATLTAQDVLDHFEHLQGELLLQSMALKALFRHLPAAQAELKAYIGYCQETGDFDQLSDIARDSLLSAAAALMPRK